MGAPPYLPGNAPYIEHSTHRLQAPEPSQGAVGRRDRSRQNADPARKLAIGERFADAIARAPMSGELATWAPAVGAVGDLRGRRPRPAAPACSTC
jgi:hypothetical protein